MATRKKSTTKWLGTEILQKLRALPAPLQNEQQSGALREATTALQNAPSEAARRPIVHEASAELIRIVEATIASRKARTFEDELLFALKLLAYMGTREGAEAVVRAIRRKYVPDAYMWCIVLGAFGEAHPRATDLFKALSKPLPGRFAGIALLDAANSAAREHGLKQHPFDSAEGQKRLAALLGPRAREQSYAVSACAALPFLSPTRRKPLLALARKHRDPGIRLEVAWATAKIGDKEGIASLTEACLDPRQSVQAKQYLTELNLKKLIPAAAVEPDFAALSEMCDWLAHPNEVGKPPDQIRLKDKRVLYWPPTRDQRPVWLFEYTYKAQNDQDAIEDGVGMVGSVTFALFREATSTMKPEDVYGLHCAWELEINADPRAPKRRTAKAGWKLIKERA